ncbi:BREX-1 system phosphatase PglZ type A [uncultured Sneathiella sp.]|uniref:BREX-1 system phosphatase PglZ type A n=1 Tax=uncultured Sneathiella sp. TaxID=879315 RepID=UPI0030DCF6DB
MDPNQIKSNLDRLFAKGVRIVLWRDEDGEFEEMLPSLGLDGVELRQIGEEPALVLKTELELEKSDTPFLLYEKGSAPDPERDWLLDVRLYAEPFAADRSTMILRELGIMEHALRDHIAARGKFFASKERLVKAQKFIEPSDDEDAIDRALMAAILRTEQTDIFSLVRALLHTIDPDNLDAAPSAWSDIEKFDLAESFWNQARDTFGLDDAEPSLKSFLMRLFITDFARSLDGACPKGLAHLVLPSKGASNAVVCVGQWRDSARLHESYDALSAAVAELAKLGDHLDYLDIEEVAEARTFLLTEKYIASRLRDRIVDTAETINLEVIRDIVTRRQNGYWANSKLPSSHNAPRLALDQVYSALKSAAEFLDLRGGYPAGFNYKDGKAFFDAYVCELYRFDQLYRHFCDAADTAEAEGWDILKALRDKIEDAYGNWYLSILAVRWGEVLEGGALLEHWQLPDVDRQQNFFRRNLQARLDEADDRRVYVIISDAFRYEAAHELLQELNGRYRFSATLKPQLGVLPSYTALGMASLLPHRTLSYTDAGAVLVDDMPTSGLANRQKILAKVDGTAIKADDFMAMNKTDGREFIKPYRVIYIYHNQIDQTADTGNEEKTFAAVRNSIAELGSIVARIVNSLNGNYVLVTADHGFLFQESAPTASDKNPITDKPSGAVISKKRYLLGKSLPDHAGAYHGRTKVTADADGDMDFWVPRGTNRFHFVGGSRFIHGGAMPQEVAVPVIQITQLKGKSAVKTRTRTAGISVLGSSLKITTSRYRFKFIQTEAVSERIKPLKVRVAIYDGDDPVSNVETLSFESDSSDMNEWRKEVWLTLASRTFDKKHRYQLIVRNAETDVEEVRIDITIDLAFDNDF